MAESDNQAGAPQAQPGQVIAPGASQPQQANPQPAAKSASASTPQASPPPTSQQPPREASPTPFNQTGTAEISDGPSDDGGISWAASEFVAHEKSAGWYGGLVAIALAIAGFVYLLTRDIISTVVVLVGAGALGALARRQPKQLQYHLDGGGISVGQKHYAYESFRSFSVVPEGAFSSIVFMPLKRFAQTTTIYYAPEDEDKIIDVLTQRLPFEEHKADVVDNLMRRIRF